MTYNVLS